jgi:hypothetical protein
MHIVMKREKILRAMGNCDDSGMPGYCGQHKYQPNEKQFYTVLLCIARDVAVQRPALAVSAGEQ